MTAHDALITVHAAAGTLALGAGALALPRGRGYSAYRWSLLTTQVALVLAVAVTWAGTPAAGRAAFTALAVLGAVVCARGWLAGHHRPADGAAPSPRWVHHVGFTLVGLADGFTVVAVLRAGAPVWAVVTTGVVVAVAGHVAVGQAERRLVRPPARTGGGISPGGRGAARSGAPRSGAPGRGRRLPSPLAAAGARRR